MAGTGWHGYRGGLHAIPRPVSGHLGGFGDSGGIASLSVVAGGPGSNMVILIPLAKG